MIDKQYAITLPQEPGIYIFKQQGKPIYIGKSVGIRTRILSHLAQASLSQKEKAIIEQADSIECTTTLSNFDAILLEAELIKKYQPKYNVSWKDNKNYLYIKITTKDRYPKIYPVRRENDRKSKYYGPFGSSKLTYTLIYELRRIVPFCVQWKIGKKACFYARIGLCYPCPNEIEHMKESEEKKCLTKIYRTHVNRAMKLLSGESRRVLSDLEKSMNEFADEEKFEEAIVVRDKLLSFTNFLERRSFDRYLYTGDSDKKVLFDEIKNFLQTHFSYTVSTSYRFECYDISNLHGSHPTGSLVVSENGELSKKDYKKFIVRRKGISDIHMMEEVLMRRLLHEDWKKPDLIILDGGKPQLLMISKLFSKLHVKIPLVSIAKRPDRILLAPNNFRPISLRNQQELYKLIQSLRDESHRFAKKYHILLRDRNRLN